MGASGHASNDGTMVGSPSRPGETGLLLIMAGPSGVGKTTIVHELIRRFGGMFSVSATTRARTAKLPQNVIETAGFLLWLWLIAAEVLEQAANAA